MLESGGEGVVVKRPLEKLVKLDPLWLLKRGEVLAAELAQEHKLLFTHRDTLKYIMRHSLGEKLERIYSDLIASLLKEHITPDVFLYLALTNDGKTVSRKALERYDHFRQKHYPSLDTILFSDPIYPSPFTYLCRYAVEKKLNGIVELDSDANSYLWDLNFEYDPGAGD